MSAVRKLKRDPSAGRQAPAPKDEAAGGNETLPRVVPVPQEAATQLPDAAAAGGVALRLRAAGVEDGLALGFFFDTALRNDYFLRRGQLDEMLRGPHHQVYVAEIEHVLVGVAVTTRGTRLVNVLVHPAYRGLGIGRALVGYSGAREVRAKVDQSTGDPRPFYAGLDFEATGERNIKGNIELMRRRPRRGSQEQQESEVD